MAKPGLVWGKRTPDDFVSTVSVLRDELSGNVERLTREFLEEAVAEMREAIRTRGVRNGVPNNEGRIVTAEMLRSVDFALTYNKNSRVLGEFGYLYNAPKYALFQEYGTQGGQGNGRGILEMLALTDAFRNFERKMTDAFANGRVLNLKQGQYANYS